MSLIRYVMLHLKETGIAFHLFSLNQKNGHAISLFLHTMDRIEVIDPVVPD